MNQPGGLTYGVRAVTELLAAGRRRVHRVWLLPDRLQGPLALIRGLAERRRLPIETADRRRLFDLAGGIGHQGVVAEADPPPVLELEELLAGAPQPWLLLVLDGVQDPQNLGSLMRSAAAFGAGGLIVPRRHSVQLTPTVIKVAAGAVEHVPLAAVTNLARALATLQDWGCWIYAIDEAGRSWLDQLDLRGPAALVLGGEGQGLRRLTRASSDEAARIRTGGPIATLNVAAAGAVALGEAARQRGSGASPPGGESNENPA